jgi:uncharacterized protein (TIGR03545 family)
MRVVRWKAVGPLLVFGGLFALAWWLLADRATERAVEYIGAEIVGARVDVAGADLRLGEGAVRLTGLAVTNPEEPMRNLFEADAIVADIRALPLLEKKIVIDTVAIRGVRFGTPRRESGALARRSPTSGRLAREISAWAGNVRVPSLDVSGLTSVVDVSVIRPESLATIGLARSLVSRGDSLEAGWRSELATLDPRPRLDSARALAERLREADPARLGLAGMRSLAESGRTELAALDALIRRVNGLDDRFKADLGGLKGALQGLAEARTADYRRALGMLKLPSLDSPDLSPALFGDMVLARVQPVLYWLRLAEEYLPPGLDPRRRVGPARARASGLTVGFPRRASLPAFLLAYAAIELELDAGVSGRSAAAGRYAATLTGLTTEPALYGRPLTLEVERRGGAAGPRDVAVTAVLDRTTEPIRDSIRVALSGLGFAPVVLPALGARLSLEEVALQLGLTRVGDDLSARVVWRADRATWTREGGEPDPRAAVGSRAWAEGVLWRAVSGLRSVEIEARLSGPIRAPGLAIGSNVGQVVAQALRRELGAQLARAEQRARAEVDRMVGRSMEDARQRAAALEARIGNQIAARRQEVAEARAALEAEVANLTRRLPVRIPRALQGRAPDRP